VEAGRLVLPKGQHRLDEGPPYPRRSLMLRVLFVLVLVPALCLAGASEARAASALSPAEIQALLTEPTRRVRAADGATQRSLAEGLRRSSTLGDLVLALNQSDVIVYIQSVRDLPQSLSGRLQLLPGPAHQRYLRIQIRAQLSPNETIALIGHELRHAIEIAEDPGVSTQATLIELYERIGQKSHGLHLYDTLAAQTAGKRVKMEL
jgi:hypothetical protein